MSECVPFFCQKALFFPLLPVRLLFRGYGAKMSGQLNQGAEKNKIYTLWAQLPEPPPRTILPGLLSHFFNLKQMDFLNVDQLQKGKIYQCVLSNQKVIVMTDKGLARYFDYVTGDYKTVILFDGQVKEINWQDSAPVF